MENTSFSIIASTRSITVALVNRDKAPLWVWPDHDTYQVDTKNKTSIIWYGYFLEIYGHLSNHYVIPPLRKVAPKQTNRWTFVPLKDGPTTPLVHGNLIQVRMRVALKNFVSKGRFSDHRQLPTLLMESCVLAATGMVPSK